MSVAKDAETKAALNVKEIKRPRINKNLPDDKNYRDWETDRKSTRLNSSH